MNANDMKFCYTVRRYGPKEKKDFPEVAFIQLYLGKKVLNKKNIITIVIAFQKLYLIVLTFI